MKILYFLLMVSLYVLNSFAQTYINGPVTSNTTWTLSGSPYIVTTNSGIFPYITLIIEPGVIIEFDNNLTFTVKGTLKAIGTSTDSITFTSSSASPTYSIWNGINIQNDQGGKIEFKFCKGLYADKFLNTVANSNDTVIKITNSYFAYNNFVILNSDPNLYIIVIDSCVFEQNKFCSIYTNTAFFSNSLFESNEKCIHGWSGPLMEINNCIFNNTSAYAILLDGYVSNSTFTNNAMAVRFINNIYLNNNIIKNNIIGIEAWSYISNPNNNITYNEICYNSSYNVIQMKTGNIDLSNNCWCSLDSVYIASTIYDAYDDMSYGIVNYTPFDTTCIISNIPETTLGLHFSMNIYPNPANDFVSINLETNKITEIKFFDIVGKLIKQEIINDKREIDVSELNAGIYFVEVSTEHGAIVNKLIKK